MEDFMVATSNNRRAQYTQQVIEDTVLQLLETKPVESISVTEVCQLADVNRTTFYRHYTDIFQCLDQIEQTFLASYSFDKSARPTVNVERMLDAFYQQRRLSNLVFVGSKTKLLDRMQATIPADVPFANAYQMTYIWSGVKAIIQQWVKAEMPETPHELTKIIFRSVLAQDLPPIDPEKL